MLFTLIAIYNEKKAHYYKRIPIAQMVAWGLSMLNDLFYFSKRDNVFCV